MEGGTHGFNEHMCVDISSSKYTVHITQNKSFLLLGGDSSDYTNNDVCLK